ncbi:MAG: TIGR02587 family membrane protein [Thermoleophilia bacterium]|nr:TIGR02587 family membrane protein [Thermoleophilia bacterium]
MRAQTAGSTGAGWGREIGDLMRAAAGGFLFGVPLLYTMEVWWYGSWVDPRWMLGALAVSLVLVVVLTRTSGFRNVRDSTWRDAAFDGVVIVAIGALCAAAILVCIREITLSTSLEETVGKVVFEAIPFALGAALARQFLSRREREEDAGGEQDEGGGGLAEDIGVDDPAIGRTLADAGAAAVGALVLCFSIAPTDEVPLIASAMSPPWLLALVAASLLISYAIVFEADFSDQAGRRQHEGPFQRPFAETVGAYVISLTVAGLALLFFQRIGPDQDWRTWLAWTVVLGLPATIGGAAGRLAV